MTFTAGALAGSDLVRCASVSKQNCTWRSGLVSERSLDWVKTARASLHRGWRR